MIAPIIFCTVVVGIAKMGHMRDVGRVGVKALVYFEAMSTLALIIGLVIVNVLRPGAGIHSIADMAGKRIGVGPRGGTAGTYFPMFLKALKIDATPTYGTWEELAAELSDGKLDVLAVASGVPFPAIAELESKKKITFVEPSREEILAMRLAMPELTPSTIPAGIYPSLNKGYVSVGLYNFAIANRDLPDDLAYAIVDAVFANHQELVQAILPPPTRCQPISSTTRSCLTTRARPAIMRIE
jgi:uncharacterized protein